MNSAPLASSRTACKIVVERSCAEIPDPDARRAVIAVVNAVPSGAWLSPTIMLSPSLSIRSADMGRQMSPRPNLAMKLIASGVTFSAAMHKSPSFSRCSSSIRMIMWPRRVSSSASSIEMNGAGAFLRGLISPNIRAALDKLLLNYIPPAKHPRSLRGAILGAMAAEITTAVLLAAGRGKRLGALTAETPKTLLDIAGSPLISHIAGALAVAGLTHLIVVTGYLSEQIEGWAKTWQRENPEIKITTVRQPQLNGTGGAMLAAKAHLAGLPRFVFGWGDILMDRANYPRFVHHARIDEYDLMLAVNRVKDPFRGAAVYVTPHMTVERLDEKPAPGTARTQWNNAGLFATGRIIFDYLARLEPSARGELEIPGAIAQMIADGRVVRAVDMRGFWSDVGTPEDLETARAWFKPKRKRR